jgi:hypothetical protein
VSDLRRQYEKFHGREPRRSRTVNFEVPKGLVVLGDAVAIEYRCNKRNGGGDGTQAVYRHRFEKGDLLVADMRMKKQLYIIGPRLIVTSAGIEH